MSSLEEKQTKCRRLLDRVITLCERTRLRVYCCGDTLRGAVEREGFPEGASDVTLAMPMQDYVRFLRHARDTFAEVEEGAFARIPSGDVSVEIHPVEPVPGPGLRRTLYLKHPSGRIDPLSAHYARVMGQIYPIELFRSGVKGRFEGLDVTLPCGVRTLLKGKL